MIDRDYGRKSSERVFNKVGGQLVVPILTFNRLGNVLDTVDAIEAGGLRGKNGLVVEVTIRNPRVGFEAVGLIKRRRPEVTVAVGSIGLPEELKRALDVGGDIIISPGAYPELYDAAQEANAAYMPGVKTSSEALYARYRGLKIVKLYKSSRDVYGEISDPVPANLLWKVPTGGVTFDNAQEWLNEEGVPFVAGSFVTQQLLEGGKRRDLIEDGSSEALGVIRKNSRLAAESLRKAAMNTEIFSS